MDIFKRDIISEIPLDNNNESGKQNMQEFIYSVMSGVIPEPIDGSWMNLISIENDQGEYGIVKYQVLAVYFNDTHAHGSVVESESPVLNSYPYDYPDAYISWDTNSYKVWELYVKPTIRRSDIGITLILLAILYAAQEGKILLCPEISTDDAIKLVQFLKKQYAYNCPQPNYANPVYSIYTPFEKIEFSEAEQIFGVNNE